MYNWKRRLMSLALAAAVSCTALTSFDVHADEINTEDLSLISLEKRQCAAGEEL